MVEQNQQFEKQAFIWGHTIEVSSCSLAVVVPEPVKHVNGSQLCMICYLLSSAEVLPLGDWPLSNALWQKKPTL